MDIPVPVPDAAFADEIKQEIHQWTRPPGGLGAPATPALPAALAQARLRPSLDNPQVPVFTGDHGTAAAGIRAHRQEVTGQTVSNFLTGGGSIDVFAPQSGTQPTLVDAIGAHDYGAAPGPLGAKMAHGTCHELQQAAISEPRRDGALARGRGRAHGPAAPADAGGRRHPHG